MVRHFRNRRQPRAGQASRVAMHKSRTHDFILHCRRPLLGHWRNITPYIPRQVPQCLGDDPSLWWLDVSYSAMGTDFPCDQRPQPRRCPFQGLPEFTTCMAFDHRHGGYHIPVAFPSQGCSALRGPFQSCYSTLVRLHDTCCWNSCTPCRTSIGRLVSPSFLASTKSSLPEYELY